MFAVTWLYQLVLFNLRSPKDVLYVIPSTFPWFILAVSLLVYSHLWFLLTWLINSKGILQSDCPSSSLVFPLGHGFLLFTVLIENFSKSSNSHSLLLNDSFNFLFLHFTISSKETTTSTLSLEISSAKYPVSSLAGSSFH